MWKRRLGDSARHSVWMTWGQGREQAHCAGTSSCPQAQEERPARRSAVGAGGTQIIPELVTSSTYRGQGSMVRYIGTGVCSPIPAVQQRSVNRCHQLTRSCRTATPVTARARRGRPNMTARSCWSTSTGYSRSRPASARRQRALRYVPGGTSSCSPSGPSSTPRDPRGRRRHPPPRPGDRCTEQQGGRRRPPRRARRPLVGSGVVRSGRPRAGR